MPKLKKDADLLKENSRASASASLSEMDKDESSVDAAKLWDFTRFYALPLFSFVSFGLIIILTIIPSIQHVFNTIDEIDVLRNDDQILVSRINKLIELNQENVTNRELITRINFLVPTGKSEVVKFRERVASAALQQGLSVEKSRTGETSLQSEVVASLQQEGEIVENGEQTVETTAGPEFRLIQIPSEFSMAGLFPNFRNFLIRMYDGDDFFIVDQMELSFTPTEEELLGWTGDFELTKYQFFTEEGFQPEIVFANVSEDEVPDPLVIEFLQNRFIEDN